MMKNKIIFCTFVALYALSINGMNPQRLSFNCFVLNPDTRKPLEVPINGKPRRFQTGFYEKFPNEYEENSVTPVRIETIIYENSTNSSPEYHLITDNSQIQPVVLTKENIKRISEKAKQGNDQKLPLAISNPLSNIATTPTIYATIEITHQQCEDALKAEPMIFKPKPKNKPEKNKPKKPKKVVGSDDDDEHSIPQINIPELPGSFKYPYGGIVAHNKKYEHKSSEKKQRRFFEDVSQNSYKYKQLQEQLISLMEEQNKKTQKAYFDSLGDYYHQRIFQIHALPPNDKDKARTALDLDESSYMAQIEAAAKAKVRQVEDKLDKFKESEIEEITVFKPLKERKKALEELDLKIEERRKQEHESIKKEAQEKKDNLHKWYTDQQEKINKLPPNQKENAEQMLAQDIVYHYWNAIENNSDLGNLSFSDYALALQNNLRGNNRPAGNIASDPISASLRNAIDIAEKDIIKKQQEESLAFKKAADMVHEKNKNRFKQGMLENTQLFAVQTGMGIVSPIAGELVVSCLTSFIDDPETRKYEKKLEESIQNLRKELEENSIDNVEKKYKEKRLKAAQKNKNLFDAGNLTKKQLSQELKDLNAKPY